MQYEASSNAKIDRAVTLLEGINNDFCGLGEDVATLAGRLHKLADRVIGARPEPAGKASPPDAPSPSSIQTFNRNKEKLGAVTSYLRDAVERLEAL
jgi:hypothetical protein